MNDFQIVWIHDPVMDIVGIAAKDPECTSLVCGTFCMEKTPESCGTYCINYAT